MAEKSPSSPPPPPPPLPSSPTKRAPSPPKPPPSPPKRLPSPPKCPANRILRCFSGRYNITEDEVKRFINVSTLVTNEKAKEIFRHFLETNKTSLALKTLNCYELADKLLNDVETRTEDSYDELKELMPAYIWEKRLDDAIEAKNGEAMVEYLLRLMEECSCYIQTHQDFRRYRKTMLDKLKKCSC